MKISRRTWFSALAFGVAGMFGFKTQWKELSKAEIITCRLGTNSIAGPKMMSDYDVLTKMLHYSDADAREVINKLIKYRLNDMKLQIMAENPVGMMVPAVKV